MIPHRFVITLTRKDDDLGGNALWLTYAAAAGLEPAEGETEAHRSWFTNSERHAAHARQYGVNVAVVDVIR